MHGASGLQNSVFPRCLQRVNLVAMAIVVDVTLISGQRVLLQADLTAPMQSLAERARRALGVGSSSGSVRDGDAQLQAAKSQTGVCLTLQIGAVRIGGGKKCFAAILGWRVCRLVGYCGRWW